MRGTSYGGEKQLRTEVGNVRAKTKQGERRKHAGSRALQAKMGKKSGNHQHRNAQGTNADDFQIVIEQHDRKGDFEHPNQVTQPLGQIEGLKLVLDVVVAHHPHEEDGSEYKDGKNFQDVWHGYVHGLQSLVNCQLRKWQKEG